MHFLETRPEPDEFNPYYATYIDKVPAGNLLELLARQGGSTARLLAGLDDAAAGHRYGPGKWSVKDVVQHVSDAERVFAYRALRIGRGDATPLASFEQEPYVVAAGADRRPIAELREELAVVRVASRALFAGLDEEAWRRRGVASGNPVSVRALGWIIAGHEAHHVAILRERYGLRG